MAANEFVHVDPGSVLTQNEYNASPGSAGGHTLGANQAVGDLIYASSAGATGIIRRLAIGTTNQTLVVSGGIPAWSSTITATTIDATTDFTVGSTVITDDVITFTPTTSDTVTMTAAANGAFSLVTVDDGGAAANIQITADGTVDIDSAGVLTLDSGAAINIEPASGSAILLDGTISIDAGVVTGATSITSTAFVGNLTGNVTGTASTATVATTVTITDNESTNEDNAIIFTAGGDVDGGNIGLESDGTLTYNPSTGKITATGFIGTLTGDVTGNVSGTAATVTTAAQSNITSLGTLTALTVSGLITANGGITFDDDDDITFTGASGTNDIVLVDGLADALSITDGSADILTVSTAGGTNTVAITGDLTVSGTLTADTATVASTVTITDNENTNESNAVIFTSGGDLDGGNIALESDGDLHYNPSSGLLTATSFAGALTGNVTGNVSGTAATVTGATQSAITAVGTLGSIDIDGGAIDGVTLGTNAAVTQAVIDNININGTTIGHTSDTDLLTLTSANLAVAGDIEVSGSVEVATIDFTDGDNSMTIADGGKVTFAAGFDVGSDASGDILYHNGTSYVRLARGSDDEVLTLASGVPSWAAATTGDITGVTAGTGLSGGGTSGGVTLNVDASQAITALTGGDLTIYEDANNADVSLKMGTSATEALTIQVLNGGSNKTAEEVHFSTATASGTADHGKMVFDIDGTDIATIDDGGVNVTSGSLETATIDYTDGDLAMTIADGGGVTFAQSATLADDATITLQDEGQIIFADDTPSTDHSGTGIVVKMTALTGLGVMECVHIDSNGKLNEADADAVTTMPAIGIALEANSSGSDADVKILTQGVVVDASWSFTPGADLFVGTTDDAGAVTATAPSGSGDTVQKIGVALTSTSAFLNFNTTEVLLA